MNYLLLIFFCIWFIRHDVYNQWHLNRLNSNYAPYPDGNVPRQGLYFSYRRVCDQYGIPHINTATLGKAIRLCFPTIKTRRLGVRGNSKYHCEYEGPRERENPFWSSSCGTSPIWTLPSIFLFFFSSSSPPPLLTPSYPMMMFDWLITFFFLFRFAFSQTLASDPPPQLRFSGSRTMYANPTAPPPPMRTNRQPEIRRMRTSPRRTTMMREVKALPHRLLVRNAIR